jgi:aromatic ring-opening dioxygenase LigB subunit
VLESKLSINVGQIIILGFLNSYLIVLLTLLQILSTIRLREFGMSIRVCLDAHRTLYD